MSDPTRPRDYPSMGTVPATQILYYGCCRCQREHFEGAKLFWEHRHYQSKHGVQSMSRAAYLAQLAREN